jgi:hypothetical protein
MIQIPKNIAFVIFILMMILFAFSFSDFNWDIFESKNDLESIFKEFREPLMFLLLTIFFLNYYVKTLKNNKSD